MKQRNYSREIPYYAAVFCNSFLQMGLFIHFQRWISYTSEGTVFFWQSLILLFAMYAPSIFMMPLASFFSGRYPKSRVMGWSSIGMALTFLAIALFFSLGLSLGAFALIFLYGIFLAIFNPAKIGIMKEMVEKNDLVKVNANQVIFMTLGILTVSGITYSYGPKPESSTLYAFFPYILSAIGLIAAIAAFSVHTKKQNKFLKIRSPKRNISSTWSNPLLRLSILGISAFWGVTQFLIMLSQNLTGEKITSEFQWLFLLAGSGYICGAFSAAKASKNFVEIGLIPFAAIVSSIAMFITPFVENKYILAFIYTIIAFWAGSAFVILRTVIQNFTRPDTSGRIHAVSFMFQMGFLFILLGFQIVLFLTTNLDFHKQFFFLAQILILSFLFTLKKTPMALLRAGLRFAFATIFRYKLNVFGAQNISETGPLLLVGSHYSFIDWAVLQMASPRPLKIASTRSTWSDWYLRKLLHQDFLIQIDRRNPETAISAINKALKNNEAVVIFPEGQVSKTPFISKFSIDYTNAIKDTNAVIVPFYIQGLWGSKYSQASNSNMLPISSTRIVTVGFAPAISSEATEDEIRMKIRDLSIDTWEMSVSHYKTIPQMCFSAMRKAKFKPILIDPTRGRHVSGYSVLYLIRAISKRIHAKTRGEKNIGFLISTSREAVISYMSILTCGKTSVNLNYTTPPDVVQNCIERCEIKTIVTTKAFYEKLCTKNPAFKPILDSSKLLFVDEIEESISWFEFIRTIIPSLIYPISILNKLWIKKRTLSDVSTILFSSGSEGTPKGILLTHKNFVANILQFDMIIQLRRSDVILAELPMFHSFGLTGNIIFPLLDATPMVLCPDPTDIKTMARASAEYKATILMGTPTFLRAFSVNRWVHPMCFDYMRFIIAGAEKLRDDMRESFKLKFGKNIFEGYGCTETTPLVSLNAPNILLDDYLTMEKCNETGSVGLPVPGSCICIADPETNEFLPQGEEGMVLVSGPQVMKEYLNDPERTQKAVVEINGHRWYKTGDKGKLNKDGFLILLDRYSRFAKLGGEMISLTAVESRLQDTNLLKGLEFITVAVSDSVKGERIVLLYTGTNNSEDLARSIRKSGIPPLMIPGSIFQVESIPKLGSGKYDFTNIKKLANELIQKNKSK